MEVPWVQSSVLAARGAVGHLPGGTADVEIGSRRRQPAAQGPHTRSVGQPQLLGPDLLEILPSHGCGHCTDALSLQGLDTTQAWASQLLASSSHELCGAAGRDGVWNS